MQYEPIMERVNEVMEWAHVFYQLLHVLHYRPFYKHMQQDERHSPPCGWPVTIGT